MKTELRVADHKQTPGAKVVEVWYCGEFVATIYPADGSKIKVITKHRTHSAVHKLSDVDVTIIRFALPSQN